MKRVDVGDDKSLCLVQKFEDGEQAVDYRQRIMLDRNIFNDISSVGIESMVISETNYEALSESGKVNQYLIFYIDNY